MAPDDIPTGDLRPAQRFDAWREWCWPAFDVHANGPLTGESFGFTNETWDLGGVLLSSLSGPPATVTRGKTNISKAPVDHWVLSYCKSGSIRMNTRGTDVDSNRKPYVWSLGEASRSSRTQVDRMDIFLPRDIFNDIGPSLDLLRGSVLDTPQGAVLAEYMSALQRWIPSIPSENLPLLGESVRAMISACLEPSADRRDEAGEEIKGLQLERIRRLVRAHLRSPSLGPEALCKAAGVSRSSLYRMFEHSGGIVHYIQKTRLLCAHSLLSDPFNQDPISSISDELCFSDPSSFSRAFKREFGCSPSEVRAAATVGHRLVPPPRRRPSGRVGTFADFLRGV